jgi:hypothetical protein
VAEVYEWSTSMGGNLSQWENLSGANQQWQLVEN